MPRTSPAILILMVILGWVFAGCNNSDCDPDVPVECDYYDKPLFGPLNVQVTVNDDNPFVPIAIYEGDVDDSILYLLDTLFENGRYEVDIDRRYSATATYRDLGRTIIAVDGDKVKSKRNYECDVECWEVNSGTINLRLKK